MKPVTSRVISNSKGFTLIELLVALALTAVVLTLASLALTSSINSAQSSREAMTDINSIARAMRILETDFKHTVARTSYLFGIATDNGFGTEIDNNYLIKFIRSGRPNPVDLRRSSLLQVGYRYQDQILYRDTWPETIDATLEDAEDIALLQGVTDFQILFLPLGSTSAEGPWVDEWPERGTTGLPIAVQVTIETEEFGRMTRLFTIVTEINNPRNEAPPEDNSGEGGSGEGNNQDNDNNNRGNRDS